MRVGVVMATVAAKRAARQRLDRSGVGRYSASRAVAIWKFGVIAVEWLLLEVNQSVSQESAVALRGLHGGQIGRRRAQDQELDAESMGVPNYVLDGLARPKFAARGYVAEAL